MQNNNETVPTIEHVLNELLLEPSDDTKSTKRVLTRLKNLPEDVLCSVTPNLDPLTILNKHANTLPYLYFITARCLCATEETAPYLLEHLCQFIKDLNSVSIREAPGRIELIPKALEHLALKSNNPLVPVLPLIEAICRIQPSRNTLTALHAPLAKACLLARAYRQPLVILDQDIEDVGNAPNMSIRCFLEYHYYGAMLYIGNRALDRALDFLSLVISAPTTEPMKVISAIQLEAYKKFVLVSLIHEGRVRPLPKFTSPTLQKTFKSRYNFYIAVAEAYEATDIAKCKTLMQQHRQEFEADKHIGLIKQCMDTLLEKKIRELSGVYLSLKLKDLSTKLGDSTSEDDAERILVHMIQKDQIMAHLSYSPDDDVKVVNFQDGATTRSSALTNSLDERIFRAANMNTRVSKIDKAEGLTKTYQIKYMAHSANGKQLANVSSEEQIEMPFEEDTDMRTS